jgi:hypothetical protein
MAKSKFPQIMLVTQGVENNRVYFNAEGSTVEDLSLSTVAQGEEVAVYELKSVRTLHVQLDLEQKAKPKNGRRKGARK